MITDLNGRTYGELRRNFRWRIPPAFNLGADCADDQDPEALALIFLPSRGDVRRYTFGDISQLSNRLANALVALGLRKRDRVAIILPQSPETAVAHIATYKAGLIALPLSVLLGPDALRYRLSDSGAKVVCTDPVGLEKVLELAPDLPGLQAVLVTESVPHGTKIMSFWETLRSGSPTFEAVETSADDPAVLIYTSGTTGPPKGALHAHRVLLGHLPGFELSHEFFPRQGDLFWTPADWAWIGGLMDALLPSWHNGVPIVAAAREGFDPEWAFRVLLEHGVRNAFLPPTVLKMLRQSGHRPEGLQLRTVMSGGEALGEEVLDWSREVLGVTVNEIYGQTEANYVVGNCAPCWPVRPGSMGLPYPGHEVEVRTDETGVASPGVVAEIVVRSPDPVMFVGYWGRPDATSEKFQGEWLCTGDLAERDDEGYLWFRGRKDDVINSAGYRIGPSEIEECLIKHDAVAMAAAIGVPDQVRGEVVKAFIVLRPGIRPTDNLAKAIREHVKVRLATYQYPREIEFVSELPLTVTGKIQRAVLRQQEREKTEILGEPGGLR